MEFSTYHSWNSPYKHMLTEEEVDLSLNRNITEKDMANIALEIEGTSH